MRSDTSRSHPHPVQARHVRHWRRLHSSVHLRTRSIMLITACSVFKSHGTKTLIDGRWVVDDYGQGASRNHPEKGLKPGNIVSELANPNTPSAAVLAVTELANAHNADRRPRQKEEHMVRPCSQSYTHRLMVTDKTHTHTIPTRGVKCTCRNVSQCATTGQQNVQGTNNPRVKRRDWLQRPGGGTHSTSTSRSRRCTTNGGGQSACVWPGGSTHSNSKCCAMSDGGENAHSVGT
ncbi:hypothetical protein BJV78DRAFT_1236728 [Lactifluus subvellereus]|nr:hypothetical protein BJV78DRAFT_1265643 [Lactifluus subvellereus]KAI0248338.1 hypothetical protein BJV78DRAFT_1236728 [Lactifluus subvellereus]